MFYRYSYQLLCRHLDIHAIALIPGSKSAGYGYILTTQHHIESRPCAYHIGCAALDYKKIELVFLQYVQWSHGACLTVLPVKTASSINPFCGTFIENFLHKLQIQNWYYVVGCMLMWMYAGKTTTISAYCSTVRIHYWKYHGKSIQCVIAFLCVLCRQDRSELSQECNTLINADICHRGGHAFYQFILWSS